MIKIVFLGTAGSSPTKYRSLPAVALVHEGDLFLFDCGESAQMQMLKFGVNSSKLRAIFISHVHGDHVIGIAGLVRTLALNRRTDPLTIFVPRGHEHVVMSLLSFDRAILGYSVEVKGIRAGEVYRGRGFSVNAFPLRHSITAYGYAFKEDDKRRFVEEDAKKLGIKGDMHSQLQKKGKIKVGTKIIKLSQVTNVQLGKKVVYTGDTRPSKDTVKAAADADLLIHESSYCEKEKSLAVERMHSTATEAAQVAKKAHVKRLLLTHISARYNDIGILEEEAQKIFKNSEVAEDGDIIIV
ncbi:MAG: ribonuclease Z [Candidatus Micrarchaeota archaeon]|nr:ribonuclease Z [Candidatus Micrarchaeota archaeon]MDE1834407.1 ribonuclease Z [Candidatus Micrarchaeota archaeon]MDE1858908.1 ribonuclease Z [Candidatus Micrarchaeota archaeon]